VGWGAGNQSHGLGGLGPKGLPLLPHYKWRPNGGAAGLLGGGEGRHDLSCVVKRSGAFTTAGQHAEIEHSELQLGASGAGRP
jgi:hypothetical protein